MSLVLFDIDGTLVLTGGAGRRAMVRTFADLYGIPDAFDAIAMPGRTDVSILAEALSRHRLTFDGEAVARFRDAYCRHLLEEIQRPRPDKRVMPGVTPILEALDSAAGVHVGLLTGNFREAARIKLEYFGLWRHFGFGAFGDEVRDRRALVPVAVAEAGRRGVSAGEASDVFVVGDTPLDVACARAAGAVAIGVATGPFDAACLTRAGADHVFADLSDVDRFLALVT